MAVYDINRILVPDAPPEYEDHTRDVHYVPAPCQVACPVGTDAPSYIARIRDEDYEGAFEAITSTNPFSSICGRVCDALCEPACRRVDSDGAVQIRNLKRFVMDKLGATYRPPAAPVTRKQSIGIVGAGPAGLVAAHDLCVAGYSVHVYEMTDRLGGMMIWGIPAFRLPPGIIDEDVDRLMQRCPGLDRAAGGLHHGGDGERHWLQRQFGPGVCAAEAAGETRSAFNLFSSGNALSNHTIVLLGMKHLPRSIPAARAPSFSPPLPPVPVSGFPRSS